MTRTTPKTQLKHSLENDTARSRFVVLQHDVGSQLTRTTASHYDWMFEIDGVLRTWATPPIIRFDQPIESACDLLSDHRLAYLDYEGEIQGNRGSVLRLLRGTYRLIDAADDRFVAELCWDEGDSARKVTVNFYRSLPTAGLRREESCDPWRFRLSPGRYETNRYTGPSGR